MKTRSGKEKEENERETRERRMSRTKVKRKDGVGEILGRGKKEGREDDDKEE